MKAIITADWHLRINKPICRKDEDWYQTQKENIEYVIHHANKKNCNLIIIGDLFNTTVVSLKIINLFLKCISKLNNNCYINIGNHDIDYGNISHIDNSGIGVILNSGNPS